MIYSIEYSKAADKTLKKWKKSNPRLFKKADGSTYTATFEMTKVK